MIRQVDIDEISDGRRYTHDDMVRISCNDCSGCDSCCKKVEDTIILDPYDMWNLTTGLNVSFEDLLNDKIMLKVENGLILPHILMREGGLGCGFLNEEGMCSIHQIRPGFCRLFPLGRIYEDGGFMYFNQVNECNHPNKSKVKIKDWLGVPNIDEYENFILYWHDFMKNMTEALQEDSASAETVNTVILQLFYVIPYEAEDFYGQFYKRMDKFMSAIGEN